MIQPVMKKDNQSIGMDLFAFFRNTRVLGILVGVACYFTIFFIIITAISPERYDIKAGDIAKETIKATKDVVDQITTKQLVDQAQAAVDPKYKQDEAITSNVLKNVQQCFLAIDQVREEGEKEKNRKTEKDTVGTGTDETAGDGGASVSQSELTFDDVFLGRMKAILPVPFSNTEVLAILEAESSEIEVLQEILTDVLTVMLNNGIQEKFLQEQLSKINQEILDPDLEISNEVRNLGMSIASFYLQANMIYDEEATEAAREKAAEAVEPVIYKKGQNIVREGERVTQAQLAVLNSLGLLKSKALDIYLYIGVGVVVFIALFCIGLYLAAFEKDVIEHTNQLIMLGLIMVLVLSIGLLVNRINPLLIPVSFGALLVTILLGPRLAIVVNMALAVLVGIMTGNDGEILNISMFSVILMSMVGGSLGIYMVRRPQQRTALITAGTAMGVANMFALIGVGLMTINDIKEILISGLWGLGNGILASILCIGTLPIWEYLFDVATPMKLLELSNPNQSLLKKLLLEAPGTYHHSIIVANLAESAADAIGGNSLLARVGSYYHDVGKLKRPYFFKENQVGPENPHDKITPNLSTLVITSHPKDGIQYAREYKIPKALQDIILQHHGSTPVLYFYHKAKNNGDNRDVKLEDFRYAGPKPQTKEAAIIMMADTVEAAVRSLPEPTQGKVECLIRKLIKEKLEDGQLDECDLTLRDLDKIANAFSKVLCGVFHERIEYPDINIKEVEGASET